MDLILPIIVAFLAASFFYWLGYRAAGRAYQDILDRVLKLHSTEERRQLMIKVEDLQDELAARADYHLIKDRKIELETILEFEREKRT